MRDKLFNGLKITEFRSRLLKWHHQQAPRDMPWVGEKDPYKVWLSEIILQQTRVEQGRDYYKRFVNQYPTISDLALAPDEQVFKVWEGLGYYSRCRNLLQTARQIHEQELGRFPDTYERILALRGIGPYTAAAISSFAFNLPHAVVDGNVFRVLARIEGIEDDILSTRGKKVFNELARDLLDPARPAAYNQAIMDFGATCCKPQSPACKTCPFSDVCVAFNSGRIDQLPVKQKKGRRRLRRLYYLLADNGQGVWLRRRQEKDIWQDLYEFILWEGDSEMQLKELLKVTGWQTWIDLNGHGELTVLATRKQVLSHQDVLAQVIRVPVKGRPDWPGYAWVAYGELDKYAFPKILQGVLNEKNVNLNLF